MKPISFFLLPALALLAAAGCQKSTSVADGGDVGAPLPGELMDQINQLERDREKAENYIRFIQDTYYFEEGGRAVIQEAELLYDDARIAVNQWIDSLTYAIREGVNPAESERFTQALEEAAQKYETFIVYAEDKLLAQNKIAKRSLVVSLISPLFSVGKGIYDWIKERREERVQKAVDVLEEQRWDDFNRI